MVALHNVVWVAGLGALFGGCGALTTTGCPDADGDGVCDVDDTCPDDPGTDDDGDGLCGAADACPDGDDAADQDEDGLADACDPCPRLPGGDADGDGVCDANDPCPETADTTCDDAVFIGLQVDGFPSESRWELIDGASNVLADGTFNRAGGGGYTRVELPVDGLYFLTLYDEGPEGLSNGSNGGVRGLVFSRQRGRVFDTFDFYDWSTRVENREIDLSGGDAVDPESLPTEAAFLQEIRFCDVRVSASLRNFPDEIGWQLRNRVDALAFVEIGDYPPELAGTTKDETFRLPEGDYVLRLIDELGDGWVEFDEGAVSVFVGGTAVVSNRQVATGECNPSLAAGLDQCGVDVPFTVSCR